MKKKRMWIFVADQYPENGQQVEVLREGKPVKCTFIDHNEFRSWKFPADYEVKDVSKPTCWRPSS